MRPVVGKGQTKPHTELFMRSFFSSRFGQGEVDQRWLGLWTRRGRKAQGRSFVLSTCRAGLFVAEAVLRREEINVVNTVPQIDDSRQIHGAWMVGHFEHRPGRAVRDPREMGPP